MSNLTKVYEGKAKAVYSIDGSSDVIQRFKDSATAFNGVKFALIASKGELNNRIASTIFRYLQREGIESHYRATLNTRDMQVARVEIVPLEVVVRNVVAGSLAKRLGLDEGTPLRRTIVEFYYKNDALGDPLLAEEHVDVLELATPAELAELKEMALAVGDALKRFWAACDLDLIDFKLEFGRCDGKLLLADEISPDTSRLWDRVSGQKMDKDVFRRDLADLTTTYTEVHRRICAAFPDLEPGQLPPAPADN